MNISGGGPSCDSAHISGLANTAEISTKYIVAKSTPTKASAAETKWKMASRRKCSASMIARCSVSVEFMRGAPPQLLVARFDIGDRRLRGGWQQQLPLPVARLQLLHDLLFDA